MQEKRRDVRRAFSVRNILILIFALSLTSNAYAFWHLRTHVTYEDFDAAYPHVDPVRNFIAQEHFITNIQPLREELLAFVEQRGLQNAITLYFEFLPTGANISVNQDLYAYPASLLKVPTAIAVMRKIEKGEWRFDNRLVLFEQDVDPDFGNRYKSAIGTTFTIDELLSAILVESDNTANRMLVRNLSIEEIAEAFDALGLNELLDTNRKMSAKEYSRIFRTLYYSSFLTPDHSEKLLALLSESQFDGYLTAGLPAGTMFAHKIGEDDLSGTYLDSGIVYVPERPYLLTIAVSGKSEAEAHEIMKEVSRMTYAYVATY